MSSYTLAELAEKLGAELKGDGNIRIDSVGTLAEAREGQISFLSNPKYVSQLAETKASAVLVNADALAMCKTNALVMKNPYLGFALVVQALDTTPDPASGIAASASISDSASLGKNVQIGANAVVEDEAVIGDDVQIGPGCFVGKRAKIGSGTKLWSNVNIYHACELGENCLIQAGAVIGSDGFGYANDAGSWVKIPQLGRAILGNRVEIGANTCIDRGALGDTILSDGVIIDNLCQIAHNVEIGENTAMAACSVIAGSTTVGRNCSFAGMVGINGHISICDQVVITGFGMITKSITESGVYSSGVPATTNKEWRKNMVGLRNIGDMSKRLKALEKRLKD